MEFAATRTARAHERESYRAFARSALPACSRADYEKTRCKCHVRLWSARTSPRPPLDDSPWRTLEVATCRTVHSAARFAIWISSADWRPPLLVLVPATLARAGY